MLCAKLATSKHKGIAVVLGSSCKMWQIHRLGLKYGAYCMITKLTFDRICALLNTNQLRLSAFQDSGGLTAAGELSEALPIWVESGREFKAEIEKLVVALDEKQEWTKRIEVMLAQTQLFCCTASALVLNHRCVVCNAISCCKWCKSSSHFDTISYKGPF